jgi:hypothetical protein
MALRYFAGGSPADIVVVHGVSPNKVFSAVWEVVDGVNSCKDLDLVFPEDHEEQKRLT